MSVIIRKNTLGRSERLELRVPAELKNKLKHQAQKAQLSMTDYVIRILDAEQNNSVPDLILAERISASYYRKMNDDLNQVLRQCVGVEGNNITLDHIRFLVRAINDNLAAAQKEVIDNAGH